MKKIHIAHVNASAALQALRACRACLIRFSQLYCPNHQYMQVPAHGLGEKAALSCTLTAAGCRRASSAAAAARMASASASELTSVPLAGNLPLSCK